MLTGTPSNSVISRVRSMHRSRVKRFIPTEVRLRMLLLLTLLVCSYSLVLGDKDCDANPFVQESGPLVRTSSGTLVGKYLKVPDTEVAAFLGIPYAKPPVNERRFLKPSPLENWAGILDATSKPPPCMQYSSRNFSWIPTTVPQEDCLFLNVWTPTKCCCKEKLPVIVWIYGGGFYSGSTDMDIYDGSTMASRRKAVIVSINYRVGIFGFLNSGQEEAPGNMGLFDQNLALKWIKKNIENFGGNPSRITLMGESAGAMSVSLHMVSPKSRGLFKAAILQSSTSYNPQLVDSKEVSFFKANKYAEIVGCRKDNSSIESDPAIMECLNGRSAEELAKAEDTLTSKLPQYFLPTFGEEFLPSSPSQDFAEGRIAPVDVLIGNAQNEATIFLNYVVPVIFKLDSEPLLNLPIAKQIIKGLFQTVPRPTANEIYTQYFQNVSEVKGAISSSEIAQTIANAFGDYVFNCPVYLFAEKLRNAHFYWYTHKSSRDQSAEWLGVPHFSEVPFVFGVPTRDAANYSPEDGQFSEELIKLWTSFVQTGNPLDESHEEEWPFFSAQNPEVYELNPKHPGKISHPRREMCEFWRPYIEPKVC